MRTTAVKNCSAARSCSASPPAMAARSDSETMPNSLPFCAIGKRLMRRSRITCRRAGMILVRAQHMHRPAHMRGDLAAIRIMLGGETSEQIAVGDDSFNRARHGNHQAAHRAFAHALSGHADGFVGRGLDTSFTMIPAISCGDLRVLLRQTRATNRSPKACRRPVPSTTGNELIR